MTNKNINKTVFVFCSIFIITIGIFQKMKIELNIIFGAMVAYFLVNLLNKMHDIEINKNTDIKDNADIYELKKSMIKPKPKLLHEYKDITQYLFSIQDYYKYNPLVYEHIVDNLDDFYHLYQEALKLNNLAGTNYKLMNNIKQDTLNSLHSLIYTLPEDAAYINKLNESFEILHKILSKYLFEIYKLNKQNILNHGYNTNTIIINHNEPIAFTTYDDIYGKKYNFF